MVWWDILTAWWVRNTTPPSASKTCGYSNGVSVNFNFNGINTTERLTTTIVFVVFDSAIGADWKGKVFNVSERIKDVNYKFLPMLVYRVNN